MEEAVFWGFMNKKTGLFKRDYRTIRYKTKTACFKSLTQAENAFKINKLENDYVIAQMVTTE